jgi:hypothetical protein
MIKMSDKLQEVELFVGEIITEKSEPEIIKEVRNKFKFNIYVDHAKDLLEEFKSEVRLERLYS